MLGIEDMLEYFDLGALEKRVNWRKLKRCPKEIVGMPDGWVCDRLEQVIKNDKWLAIDIRPDMSNCDVVQFAVTFNKTSGLYEMYSRTVVLGGNPEYMWQEQYNLERFQNIVVNFVYCNCTDEVKREYIKFDR